MITREQILKLAINNYGIEPQINQLVEEIGELLQAINKVRRKHGIIAGNTKVIPVHEFQGTNEEKTAYSLAYNALCGEVADVQIVLDQLKIMLNPETINLVEVRKVERLKTRLGI